MGNNRLEAFSDGVFAILLTILVLEMHVPHGAAWADLAPVLPVFLSYVLSFLYVGIYWNNHHHLLHLCRRPTGAILWANLHLLFWLSLLPFLTGWMGENHFAAAPAALYGAVLLCAAGAYAILQRLILTAHGCDSEVATVFGHDWKGKLSPVGYALGGIVAFLGHPTPAIVLYYALALLWLIPDRRVERSLAASPEEE